MGQGPVSRGRLPQTGVYCEVGGELVQTQSTIDCYCGFHIGSILLSLSLTAFITRDSIRFNTQVIIRLPQFLVKKV